MGVAFAERNGGFRRPCAVQQRYSERGASPRWSCRRGAGWPSRLPPAGYAFWDVRAVGPVLRFCWAKCCAA
eukprot:9480184-Alexandrium_andersonii.AAC.1